MFYFRVFELLSCFIIGFSWFSERNRVFYFRVFRDSIHVIKKIQTIEKHFLCFPSKIAFQLTVHTLSNRRFQHFDELWHFFKNSIFRKTRTFSKNRTFPKNPGFWIFTKKDLSKKSGLSPKIATHASPDFKQTTV